MSFLFGQFEDQIIKMIEFEGGNLGDIEDDERYREMVRNQACIGIFVIFTAKRMHYDIKEKGESWDGKYFRETILEKHVFPLLKNQENVIDVNQVFFIHDKAPYMRAVAAQQLIRRNNIDFWGKDIRPGNSPDMNAAWHIGSIIKDEVEKKMLSETGRERFSQETLKGHIKEVLREFETNTELFVNFLCSYPSRISAVIAANCGHTDY
jgi:hypothetical protein